MLFRKKTIPSKTSEKTVISRRMFTKILGVASLSLGLQPLIAPSNAKASFNSGTAQAPVNELQAMIVNQIKLYKKLPDVNGEALEYALHDVKLQHHLSKHLFQFKPVSLVKS